MQIHVEEGFMKLIPTFHTYNIMHMCFATPEAHALEDKHTQPS